MRPLSAALICGPRRAHSFCSSSAPLLSSSSLARIARGEANPISISRLKATNTGRVKQDRAWMRASTRKPETRRGRSRGDRSGSPNVSPHRLSRDVERLWTIKSRGRRRIIKRRLYTALEPLDGPLQSGVCLKIYVPGVSRKRGADVVNLRRQSL